MLNGKTLLPANFPEAKGDARDLAADAKKRQGQRNDINIQVNLPEGSILFRQICLNRMAKPETLLPSRLACLDAYAPFPATGGRQPTRATRQLSGPLSQTGVVGRVCPASRLGLTLGTFMAKYDLTGVG